MNELEAKIIAFIAGKPWLKIILTLAMSVLGTAKGRGWFARKYNIQ